MQQQEKEKLFHQLLEQSKGSIYRVCKAYLYDTQQTEDLFQEILIEVWRSIERFQGKSKWNTYVYRIAVNTAIKYNLQQKKAQRKIEIPFQPTSIAEKVKQEQQYEMMYQAIQQLNAPDRLLISLVLEDLSYKEIAEILSSSTNLVGVRIGRVKKRIIKIIEKAQHERYI